MHILDCIGFIRLSPILHKVILKNPCKTSTIKTKRTKKTTKKPHCLKVEYNSSFNSIILIVGPGSCRLIAVGGGGSY